MHLKLLERRDGERVRRAPPPLPAKVAAQRAMLRSEAIDADVSPEAEAIDADLGLAALRQAARFASALERPWSRAAASDECGICMEPLYMPCMLQCGHVFNCACLLRIYARAPGTHAPCPSCRSPFTLDHAARAWAEMAQQRKGALSEEREREMQLALRELGEKQRARLSAPPPPLRRRALAHLASSASCRRSGLSFCIGLACMLGWARPIRPAP